MVTRIRTYGHVNRQLVGLSLTGTAPAGSEIQFEGKRVGNLTSVAGSIALTVIRREAAAPGTALQVDTQDGAIQAEVTTFPIRVSAR